MWVQRSIWAMAVVLGGLPGCRLLNRGGESAPAGSAAASAAAGTAPVASGKGADEKHGKGHHAEASGENESGHAERESPQRKLSVPFVREDSGEDPLDATRGFFADLFRDNANFVRTHDAGHFKTFIESQKPRVTMVACSDSRVQTVSFDTTPENDLFTIRNIGNQLITSRGSVEYGVHNLKTPVLLIMGHTGCGAVKAAMGDFSKESLAIRDEIETISLPKKSAEERKAEKKSKGDDDKEAKDKAWADAVAVNVHNQVSRALEEYGEEVANYSLTVVGAIYDLHNDLQGGSGKVHLIDVNGYTDPAKITAFVKAIEKEGGLLAKAGGSAREPEVLSPGGLVARLREGSKRGSAESEKAPPLVETHGKIMGDSRPERAPAASTTAMHESHER